MKTLGISKIKVPNFKLVLTPEDREFILEKIGEVLQSHRWTVGRMGEAFEEEFKRFVGAPHAVALSSGGAALVAILQALKIPEGSIVLCPTLTAPPTPHAILNARMRVLFADSNPGDLGLDLEDVKRKLDRYRGEIRAVMAVHVGGWISPRLPELKKLCNQSGIFLIEDCAHAHGSRLNGNLAGSFSGLAAYSFFMTKPLASGEGGIVTAEDRDLIEAIRIIRNYGKDREGKHVRRGFNYKLSEFDAVIALWAASRAPRLLAERRSLATRYDELLRTVEGLRIMKVPNCEASYYKYIVTLEKPFHRDEVRRILLEEYGVEVSGGVYDTLCHEEPFFCSVPEEVVNGKDRFPQAERFARGQLCLPLYPGLTEEEQREVVHALASVLASLRRKQR